MLNIVKAQEAFYGPLVTGVYPRQTTLSGGAGQLSSIFFLRVWPSDPGQGPSSGSPGAHTYG